MKTISLKELHQHTGRYARSASEQPVVITDHNRPVALLSGPVTADLQKRLPRKFTRTAAVHPKRTTRATATVSQLRGER